MRFAKKSKSNTLSKTLKMLDSANLSKNDDPVQDNITENSIYALSKTRILSKHTLASRTSPYRLYNGKPS